MSYLLGYVTSSFKTNRSTNTLSHDHHRHPLGTRLSVTQEDSEEDDDSALIEEIPLISTEHREYGTIGGFTSGYVDWSHSHESVSNALWAFGAYILVAIVGYSYVFEKWSILDSMYFAVTVFTTVGYGDLAPSTDVSRFFTIFFASGGIIILGVFLGIIGTRLFELREERVNVKLQGVQKQVMTQFDTAIGAGEVEMMDHDDAKKEGEEERESFAKDVWEIIKIESPLILALMVLASPVVYLEGWDFVMGIYWMFVTGTTIGFGDLSPTHTWTKVICIIYLPLAAAVFGELLAQIAGAYIERCSDEIEDAFLDRALKRGDLEKMDLENNNIVKPYEFLSYMLVTLGKVIISYHGACLHQSFQLNHSLIRLGGTRRY